MYSSNDFGNALADLGYVVHKGNGWNYVLYNDKAYYVNREASDKNEVQLDEHAAEKRQEAMKEFIRLIDTNRKADKAKGNPYTVEEVNNAIENLQSAVILAKKSNRLPISTDLTEFFLDQNTEKHGIILKGKTKENNMYVEFGPNSVINRELKSNKKLNKSLLRLAYNKYRNLGVEMPTHIDSVSFYLYDLDSLLAFGAASYDLSYKIQNNMIYANMTFKDIWDHNESEKDFPITKEGYILQQSGAREVFAYSTTYSFHIPLSELYNEDGDKEYLQDYFLRMTQMLI